MLFHCRKGVIFQPEGIDSHWGTERLRCSQQRRLCDAVQQERSTYFRCNRRRGRPVWIKPKELKWSSQGLSRVTLDKCKRITITLCAVVSEELTLVTDRWQVWVVGTRRFQSWRGRRVLVRDVWVRYAGHGQSNHQPPQYVPYTQQPGPQWFHPRSIRSNLILITLCSTHVFVYTDCKCLFGN